MNIEHRTLNIERSAFRALAVALAVALLGPGCASVGTYQRNSARAQARAISAMQTAGGAGIGLNLLEAGKFTPSEMGLQAAAALLDLGTGYLLFEAGRQYESRGADRSSATNAPRDHSPDVRGDNNHVEYNY